MTRFKRIIEIIVLKTNRYSVGKRVFRNQPRSDKGRAPSKQTAEHFVIGETFAVLSFENFTSKRRSVG